MTDVTVTQVARNFADFVNRVAYRGDMFTLLRGNKRLAELRPVPAGVRLSELPSLLAALPRLTEAEAGGLAADLEASRSESDEAPRSAFDEAYDAWGY